jgi:hypothetical protein
VSAAAYPIPRVEDDPTDAALIQRAFDNDRAANALCILGDGERTLGAVKATSG